YFLLSSLLSISMGTSYAQCGISTTGTVQTLTISGGTGSSQVALVHNPIKNVYYAIDGNRIRTHSGVNGAVLSSYYFSTTMRGLWWNPGTSQLEGNAYGNSGIYQFTVGASNGYVSGGTVLFSGSHQPNYQSQGAFDDANNEMLFFNGSSIYRYSRLTGVQIGTISISNMPASYGLTNYNIVYTGCVGKEIGLYDRINRKLLFINKATGSYVGASQLPTSAGTPYNWGVSIANDKLWVLSGTSWNSYEVMSFGLQTSAISGPFCDSSNVSVNFTLNSLSFNAGNVFTAQMSNASGSFSSPTTIGSVASITASTIAAIIPANTPAGSSYRIRVVSSNPVQTGGDNGTNIVVNVPNVNLGPDVSYCPGDTTVLTSPLGVLSYNWSSGGTNQIENVTTAGTYSVTVSNSVCSKSDTILVTALTAPTPTLSDTVTLCSSSTVLDAGTFSSYLWSTGATGSTITANNSGAYKVTVTGSNTCTAVDESFVNLLDPNINNGDTAICAGDTLELSSATGCFFTLSSLTLNNTSQVGANSYTGDDRGGIAITPNYVYLTGDNYTARYSANLTNPTSLSRRDGLFSDLSSGQLYTFWNSTNSNFNSNTTYTNAINSLRTMDASLNYTGSVITLSQTINAGYSSMVFAGSGYVILWSKNNSTFYKIDLPTGNVTNLGFYNMTGTYYGAENWASWGVAECNGQGHSVVFRANSNSTAGTNSNTIARFNISTSTFSLASTFTSASLSDMASLTYSPWNSRWYFHSEGGNFAGSNSENIGYADASHNGVGGTSAINSYAWSTGASSPNISIAPTATTNYSITVSYGATACSDTIAVTVNTIPTISLVDTANYCNVDSVQISAATGFSSYVWSNGATAASTFVDALGYYSVSVTNSNGCLNTDSTFVNLLDARIDQVDTTLCSADSVDLSVNSTCGFELQSLTLNNLNSVFDQHGGHSGGIAVTRSYIYSNGTSYCTRYNLDLNTYTNLPVRDGIFSDLSNGQLYTFWNTAYNNFSRVSTYTQAISAIRKMDAGLAYGATIPLSQTINASNNSLVAAGTGFVILWSGSDNVMYKITLSNGNVEVLGTHYIGNNIYFYNGWASYGVAECTDAGISFVAHVGTNLGQGSYRSLGRYDLTTSTWTDAAPTANVYSSMTDLTYSRWNDRWYFAHQSSRSTLGQFSPSVCYADATSSNSGGGNSGNVLWSSSDTNATISVSPNTTTNYNVAVSSGSNICRDTVAITVIQSPAITAVITNLSCFADTNGSASLAVTGGTTPYSYAWSNSDTTTSVSSLMAGVYAYSVTGGNNCVVIDSVEITSPSEIVVVSTINTAASCYGSADGSATVSVSGGTSSYTYLWPSGTADSTDAQVAGGLNVVTITDANNCVVTDSVTVTSPTQIISPGPITSTATFYCPGTTGTLVASNGNVGLVSRTLNRSSAVQNPTPYYNSQMSHVFTGLPTGSTGLLNVTINFSGQYSSSSQYINAFDENNSYIGRTRYTYTTCGNTQSVSFTISATQLQNYLVDGTLSIKLTPYNYYSSYCAIQTSVDISYTYDENVTTYWFSTPSTDTTQALGSGASLSVAPQVTTMFYSSNFGDGCNSEFDSISVIVPPAPNTTYLQNPTSVCAGETINVNAYGAITYTWPTGDPTISGSGSTATVVPTGSKDYLVTITNAFNCSYVDTMKVVVKPAPLGNVLTTTNVTCSNATDGQAVVYATGGQSPYTYSWSNGNTGALQLGLPAGTYQITILDAGLCSDSMSVTVGGPVPMVFNETLNDISCNGAGDGSISLAVAGGSAPYTYAWSNGQTASVVSSLAAGSYSVTITDNTACTHDTAFTILEPTTLMVSIGSTSPETCPGVGNGSVTSLAMGGTAPYSFNWDNGGTSAVIGSLNGGLYNLTITDAKGCTAVTSATVTTTPSSLASTIGSVNDVLCFNGSDGSAIVSAAGGNSPYVYSWNDGTTTANITGTAGTYTVTITDANSCENVNSVTINEPTALVVSSNTFADASCFGLTDGSASITASGATLGYTFAWPDGSTSIANTNLGAGLFQVTVTDANSCMETTQVTITEPVLLLMNPTVTDITCNGVIDGSITTTVAGGTPSYTYSWSTSATTSSVSALAVGSYSLTVTDANNCQVDSTFTIAQPNSLAASVNSISHVICKGNNSGEATAAVAGGTAPFSYSWSNSVTSANNPSLIVGTYEVTITDVNGCFDSASVVIIEPATLLTISISGATDVLCNSLATGSATVVAIGGGAPYSYLWSNGYTDSTNANLVAGNYSVTVTDNNGCIKSTTVNISEPTDLVLNTVAQLDVTCFGANNGSATVFGSGGTTGYSYSWSNGSATSSISSEGPGTYSLTVTDGNGCAETTSLVITEPTDLSASISNFQNVACNGSATGFAKVTGAGGILPYAFAWDNGNTTDSIFNQSSGFYKVTITDANGCIDSTLANLTQPNSLIASVTTSTNNVCYGDSMGSASVTVVGGALPYVYAWPTGVTTPSASALLAGNHIVTVTDVNNCQDTTLVTISEPSDILLTIANQSNALCLGNTNGEVAVSATGGVTGFTFAWNNGDADSLLNAVPAGNYTVTVTDANSCMDSLTVIVTEPTALVTSATATDVLCYLDTNGMITTAATGGTMPMDYVWSTGDMTNAISNVAANTYRVTITDANGCADTLTAIVGEPTALVNTLGTTVDLNCNDGTTGIANTATIGGITPYVFAWTGGQNVESPTNLNLGTHVLTVTDANGCIDSTIVSLIALSNLDLTLVSATDILCNGDTTSDITVTSIGGSGALMYSWSVAGTDSILLNQGAGTYVSYVTDNLGCMDTLDVVIAEPTLINGTVASSMNPICFGDSLGWAQVAATGGVGTHTYLWPSGDTTDTDSLLNSSVYVVTISDSNNCSNTFDVVLVDPAALTNTGFNISNVSCYFDVNGSIIANPIGGTLPYSVLWSNGQTGNNAIGLTGGVYAMQVTDANGCVLMDTAQVISVNALTPSMLPNDTNHCGTSVTLNANPVFTSYNWSTGASTPSVQITTTATILFNGLDANGCNTYDTVQVNVFPAAVVNLGNDISNICEGTAQVLDAGSFVSYLWSNGDTTQTVTIATSGTYLVTATDVNGCIDQDDIEVTMWANPIVDLGNDTSLCFNLGQTSLDMDAGTGFVSYNWSTGSSSQIETVTTTGDYSVIVEDGNGCSGTDSVLVTFDICSGISEPGQSLVISMYPNPTKGDLTIDLKGFLGQTVEIEIMTTNGQLVKKTILESNNQSELNTQIDLNGVAQGLYFVVVKSGEEVRMERITIY
ncbi:MAG: hypothetical protein ACI85Q_001394, partial [Salibacteraceae bacterium]